MPLPKITPEESKAEFIPKCMRDKKVIEEFPDEEQRYAVCVQQAKR